MNIKKAFNYMISHSTKEDRPAYEQICLELSDHVDAIERLPPTT